MPLLTLEDAPLAQLTVSPDLVLEDVVLNPDVQK